MAVRSGCENRSRSLSYDIIGDIHGEADKLRRLLSRLRYAERHGVLWLSLFIDPASSTRRANEKIGLSTSDSVRYKRRGIDGGLPKNDSALAETGTSTGRASIIQDDRHVAQLCKRIAYAGDQLTAGCRIGGSGSNRDVSALHPPSGRPRRRHLSRRSASQDACQRFFPAATAVRSRDQ